MSEGPKAALKPSILFAFSVLAFAACGGGGGASTGQAGTGGPDGGAGTGGQVDAAPDAPGGDAAAGTGGGGPFQYTGACTPLGARFCSVNPRPFPAAVTAIDAVAADDVWFVGTAALVAHWDGAALRVLDTGLKRGTAFSSVDAVSATCVWAAGSRTVVKWDGAAWTKLADPPVDVNQLVAPSCDKPVVRSSEAVYEWTGTAWELIADGTKTSRALVSITAMGAAPGKLWMGGNGDMGIAVFERGATGLVDRSPPASLEPEIPENLLVEPSGRVTTMTIHLPSKGAVGFTFENGTWTRLPAIPFFARGLTADAAGTRWVVGFSPTEDHSKVASLDGAAGVAWKESTRLFRPELGGNLEMGAIASDGAGGLWVGGLGLARFTAGAWTTLTGGPAWQRTGGARVGDAVWTTGVQGLITVGPTGVTFKDMTAAGSAVTQKAIHVRAASDVYIGGYDFKATAPIVHWDGAAFAPERVDGVLGVPSVESLFDVGGAPWGVQKIVSVPASSAVVRRAAAGWQVERAWQGGGTFTAGWSDGATAVTVGVDAANRRVTTKYAGGAWGEPVVGGPPLQGIGGSDLTHLYGYDQHGVYRFTGADWQVLRTFDAGVQDVTGVAAKGDHVWVTFLRGESESPGSPSAGSVAHFDGTTWEELIVPGLEGPTGPFFVGDTLWIVGLGGAIVKAVTP